MKCLPTAPLARSSLNTSQRNPCTLTVYPVFLGKNVSMINLFDYQGAQFRLVTDYYNKYPIVRKLNSTTSAAVINNLESIFAENGIPETFISDNSPQYSSQEFAAFCKQWGIDQETSSPLYPQSNGFVEQSVQTVKDLQKAEALGEDPYLALLTYRTTPVDSNLPSPSQLLNCRAYLTQLTCSGHLRSSQAFDSHREQLQNQQDTQRNQYGRQSTHELWRLNQGQQVVSHRTKTWIPAEVKEKTCKPRSYIVKTTGGSELRCNRVRLKPLQKTPITCGGRVVSNQESTLTDSHETKPLPFQMSSLELTQVPAQSLIPSNQSNDNLPVTTLSGCIVKKPSRLDLQAPFAVQTLIKEHLKEHLWRHIHSRFSLLLFLSFPFFLFSGC